jgi:hypothetical protein
MEEACNTHGVYGNARRVLVGKPEEKRLLGRPRSRLDDIIKEIRLKFVKLTAETSGGLL